MNDLRHRRRVTVRYGREGGHGGQPEPPFEVRQSGPRRLWDEVAGAYRWWLHAGEPTVHDWLFTVTTTGTTIALEPLTVGASPSG